MEGSVATLSVRPYAGEVDLQPIADLLNACEAVDKLDEGTSVDELRTEFASPSLDKERDLRLWEDGDGKLIGFGELWIPESRDEADAWLWFKVHPEERGRDIEAQIISWGEERMREVGQERGKPAKLRAGARDSDVERIALLEKHGFTVARYFFRMGRPLDEPIPEPQFPEGFTLRYVAGPEEAETWVACFNQSFIDHWNHHDMRVEDRKHWMSEPYYQAERDLIAVAPDGTFAAFCWCSINPQENARTGRNEGWINILGTRRGYRKIGLGRAMLLAGLQRLKADGVDMAVLGVDAENPTGALRLYESVGFRKLFATIGHVKDV